MTEEDRRKAEACLVDFLQMNDFEFGLKVKSVYNDEIILAWITSAYRVAYIEGYAAAVEAKRAGGT